jgi:hypothetical protein
MQVATATMMCDPRMRETQFVSPRGQRTARTQDAWNRDQLQRLYNELHAMRRAQGESALNEESVEGSVAPSPLSDSEEPPMAWQPRAH